MKKTPAPAAFVFRDEVLAAGVDHYELICTEDDLEKLMQGYVSHALMETAFRLLSWKREGRQVWEHYDCSCSGCSMRRVAGGVAGSQRRD